MRGTEKQIAWAEAIRNRLEKDIAAERAKIDKEKTAYRESFCDDFEICEMREKILDMVAQCLENDDAKWWIDNRTCLMKPKSLPGKLIYDDPGVMKVWEYNGILYRQNEFGDFAGMIRSDDLGEYRRNPNPLAVVGASGTSQALLDWREARDKEMSGRHSK